MILQYFLLKITADDVLFRRVDVLIHKVMVKKQSIQNVRVIMVLFTILAKTFINTCR